MLGASPMLHRHRVGTAEQYGLQAGHTTMYRPLVARSKPSSQINSASTSVLSPLGLRALSHGQNSTGTCLKCLCRPDYASKLTICMYTPRGNVYIPLVKYICLAAGFSRSTTCQHQAGPALSSLYSAARIPIPTGLAQQQQTATQRHKVVASSAAAAAAGFPSDADLTSQQQSSRALSREPSANAPPLPAPKTGGFRLPPTSPFTWTFMITYLVFMLVVPIIALLVSTWLACHMPRYIMLIMHTHGMLFSAHDAWLSYVV